MTDSTQLARRLLEAIEEHARDAIATGVPREVYIQVMADHAAATYDRLKGDVPPSP